MGYSIGFDGRHDRFIGYGVPAICEHPECKKKIDRGMSYVCENCGLFFCSDHLWLGDKEMECERCYNNKPPFDPKPDTNQWMRHQLKDPSWKEWRSKNPEKCQRMLDSLKK